MRMKLEQSFLARPSKPRKKNPSEMVNFSPELTANFHFILNMSSSALLLQSLSDWLLVPHQWALTVRLKSPIFHSRTPKKSALQDFVQAAFLLNLGKSDLSVVFSFWHRLRWILAQQSFFAIRKQAPPEPAGPGALIFPIAWQFTRCCPGLR